MAFLLLKRKRNASVAFGLKRHLPLSAIENLIRADMAAVARHAFDLARINGGLRLGAELDSLKIDGYRKRVAAQEILKDAHRAEVTSDAYSARWAKAAEETTIAKAGPATDWALERAARTEAARAFNEERLERARELPEDIASQLQRMWDAEYGACPICAAEDGTIVGVNESFPLGEPGSVHPNCACSWSLVLH